MNSVNQHVQLMHGFYMANDATLKNQLHASTLLYAFVSNTLYE